MNDISFINKQMPNYCMIIHSGVLCYSFVLHGIQLPASPTLLPLYRLYAKTFLLVNQNIIRIITTLRVVLQKSFYKSPRKSSLLHTPYFFSHLLLFALSLSRSLASSFLLNILNIQLQG